MTENKICGLKSFLETAGNLKRNLRHAWQADGRRESVAEHCCRLAVMAVTLREEQGIDYCKVLKMCVLHDLGEAITGDIPSFLKKEEDEDKEFTLICEFFRGKLPRDRAEEFCLLFEEMAKLSTKEARYFKALDKLEAVMQHNEGGTSSWLPLEYELQMSYGREECAEFPELAALRAEVAADTEKLIAAQKCDG